MNRSGFQLIAIIGIILGVLLLAIGIVASRYFIWVGSPPEAVILVRPYATASNIVFGAGVISIFVGIIALRRASVKNRNISNLTIASPLEK